MHRKLKKNCLLYISTYSIDVIDKEKSSGFNSEFFGDGESVENGAITKGAALEGVFFNIGFHSGL